MDLEKVEKHTDSIYKKYFKPRTIPLDDVESLMMCGTPTKEKKQYVNLRICKKKNTMIIGHIRKNISNSGNAAYTMRKDYNNCINISKKFRFIEDKIYVSVCNQLMELEMKNRI
jgi:hypothetical protein